MLKQKYLFEPFLLFSSKYFVLIRPSEGDEVFNEYLPEAKNIINSTNIYFVCKKPRLRFSEKSILNDNKNLQIGFELITKSGSKTELGILENYHKFFPNAIEFSIHPTRKSQLFVKNKSNISLTYPIEEIFSLFDANKRLDNFSDEEVLDYEILYIGQSLGIKNQSNAYKRIMKHQKLQKILADCVENEPYNEIFILLITLDNPTLFGISDPRFCNDQANNNFDSLRNLTLPKDNMSQKEIVNITEAGLIKYFCPPYNTLLKNKFPHATQKLLEKCRKHDINSVSIIIDTASKNLSLFSQKVKSNCTHRAQFRIHSQDDRVSFQDIMDLTNLKLTGLF